MASVRFINNMLAQMAKILTGSPTVDTVNHVVDNMHQAGNPIEEKDNNQNRLASVDTLKKNMSLDPKSYKKYIQSIKLSPDNPFFPTLTSSGQVKWISHSPVSAKHVHEVVRSTIKKGRSLHINTGTHGNPEGQTVVQNSQLGEPQFTKEDINFAWKKWNVSIHIMSKHSPALTEKQYPLVDIIDAWCYSEASQHLMHEENDELAKQLHEFIIQNICKQPAQTNNISNNLTINSMSGNAQIIQASGGNAVQNNFYSKQKNRNPRNIAEEIGLFMRNRRVLYNSNDIPERCTSSLIKIREFLLEKELDLSRYKQTDTQLFNLIDSMLKTTCEFLDFEETRNHPSGDAKNWNSEQYREYRNSYFDKLMQYRSSVLKDIDKIKKLAKEPVQNNQPQHLRSRL